MGDDDMGHLFGDDAEGETASTAAVAAGAPAGAATPTSVTPGMETHSPAGAPRLRRRVRVPHQALTR